MERKVGEVFNDGENKIEVVYDIGCNGCFFYKNICTRTGRHLKNCGECYHSQRNDRKSVKFIKIGESKMDNKEKLKRSLAEEEQRAKDILANVEKMKKQLEELNKKQEQPTVSANGNILNFKKQNKYIYYVWGDNEVTSIQNGESLSNNNRLKTNSLFSTEKQAEQESLRREGQEFIRRCAMLWNKGNDWRKKEDCQQHTMFFDIPTSTIQIVSYSNYSFAGVFFDTKELAEKCIAELKAKYNEEQIKVIFGVK